MNCKVNRRCAFQIASFSHTQYSDVLCDLLIGIFSTLTEAKVLIEQWRKEYNQVQPHSASGYRPPVPEAIIAVILT